MGFETEMKQQLLQHLMTEREEVVLTCERCATSWEIAGPFEMVVAFACPSCEKSGSISLVRQVERMVASVMEQFESRIAEQYMQRAERYGAAAGPAPSRSPVAHAHAQGAGHVHGAGCGSHGGGCC